MKTIYGVKKVLNEKIVYDTIKTQNFHQESLTQLIEYDSWAIVNSLTLFFNSYG